MTLDPNKLAEDSMYTPLKSGLNSTSPEEQAAMELSPEIRRLMQERTDELARQFGRRHIYDTNFEQGEQ